MNTSSEQFQNRKKDDSGNFKFDNFSGSLSDTPRGSFNMMPTRLAPGKIYSGYNMPCFHPKSGEEMPCLKPKDRFPMRVFNPENVTWGILW